MNIRHMNIRHMSIRRNASACVLLLAGFLVTGLAYGADAVPGKSSDAGNIASTGTKSASASKPISVGSPQLAGMSQQNKMKECNRLAKGQKGDERRSFMKSCLSNKKA